MSIQFEPTAVRGIVFDLYHTLVHITAKVDPYRRFLRALDFSHGQIERERRRLMTEPMGSKAAMSQLFAPDRAVPDYDLDHDLLVELNSTRLYADTRPTLATLQERFPLFLLSNITTHYKAPFFRLGLEPSFRQVFFSCDLGHIKPEAELFAEVEKATGFGPQELLMVGDSPKSDFFGARDAGWQSLLLDRTGRWSHAPSIQSLSELPGLLRL